MLTESDFNQLSDILFYLEEVANDYQDTLMLESITQAFEIIDRRFIYLQSIEESKQMLDKYS